MGQRARDFQGVGRRSLTILSKSQCVGHGQYEKPQNQLQRRFAVEGLPNQKRGFQEHRYGLAACWLSSTKLFHRKVRPLLVAVCLRIFSFNAESPVPQESLNTSPERFLARKRESMPNLMGGGERVYLSNASSNVYGGRRSIPFYTARDQFGVSQNSTTIRSHLFSYLFEFRARARCPSNNGRRRQ